MSFIKSQVFAMPWFRTAGVAMLVYSGAVLAQPAQSPLLSHEGGGVKPNIMLTMDDSGSMMFQHMPEATIYAGSYTLVSPVGTQSVRMDPGDNATLASHFIGTVAAQPGTSNYRQKLLRSADTNTIYYNPEVRYLPWALATYPLPAATSTNPAGRMANSPVAAAYRDPLNPAGGGTINLTNVRSVDTTWCYRDSKSDCSSNSENYDPGLYFRLDRSGGAYKDPSLASSYSQYSINATAGTTFTKHAARTDCVTTAGVCTRDEERRNFANWFTYYRTRNLMARGALVESFAEAADNFRIGWGRINDGTDTSIDGVNTKVIAQGVRDFTPSHKASLFTWLYGLPALGGTPLPRAMRSVGQYYSRTDSKSPWSDNPGGTSTEADKTCRRAYHIMVTDGYWNETTTAVGNSDNTDGLLMTGPVNDPDKYTAVRPYKDGNSNTLADYAMEYWKKDLNPGLTNKVKNSIQDPAFWQHMTNFMVGLGVRGKLDPATDLPKLTSGDKTWGTDEIDDLWHSALNSRGDFFNAKDPVELAKAIRTATDRASADPYKEGGVATTSTVFEGDNRKYVPQFKSGSWSGDVLSYRLTNGVPGPEPVWTAESKLPASGARNIVTWSTDTVPASAVPFTWAGMGAANQTNLGTLVTVPSSTPAEMVDFLRGDRSKEGDDKPFRARKGVLGDFGNSNPVLVKDSVNLGYGALPAAQGGSDTRYASFLTAKAARTATLFVGGNDGMLHAFKDTATEVVAADDGKEVFAYVPKTVYPNLSKLGNKNYGTTAMYHQYYVDGPLVESDAFVNAPGATDPSWRNYLVGTLGAGGRAVFALDVTGSPVLDASAVRWELSSATNADLGYVTAPAEVGVLPNGEWVAIFGNGRFSSAGKATLFVVNLQTGVAKTLDVDTGGSNGLGGVGVVRNGTGQITTLYAGDLKGKLWKFDYQATATSRFEVSGGAAFFTAAHADSTAQSVVHAPIMFDHSKGGKIVVFGTGRLSTETDAGNMATQAIYGVWDKDGDTVARPMGRSLLQPRALSTVTGAGSSIYYELSGIAVDWDGGDRGWVINLDLPSGMRVLYPSQRVSSKLVLVSAVKPASSGDVCDSAVGTGINLLIPVETGSNPTYRFFDTNGDDAISSSDAIVVGYATNADGVDAVLKSKPVCSGSVCRTTISLQNTTGYKTGAFEEPNPSTSRVVKDRVWRRIINPPIR
jgi:type IV pilus assembly protein PilY1